MSEPSGRYQSRILSFVSRQTQKLADKTATVLRQLKVTTIWSTQIVLYPVYALFQTARLVGRQLRQAGQKIQERLAIGQAPPPSAPDWLPVDAPIQQILVAINQANWLAPFIPPAINDQSTALAIVPTPSATLTLAAKARSGMPETPFTLFPSFSPLQGLACRLDRRSLVLITTDNQQLDILTPDQQQHLQRQIIWVLASYWYARRRRAIGSGLPPLPPPRDRATALPPVRIFGQLMAWMQTGPIATTANLFQEASWAIEPAELDWFNPELPPATLAPINPIKRNLPSSLALADWPSLTQRMPAPNQIPDLIQAAWRYFFGDRPSGLIPEPSAHLTATQIERPRSAFSLRPAPPPEDPWLTLADLGGGAPKVVTQVRRVGQRRLNSPQLALPSHPQIRWRHPWRGWFQRNGGRPAPLEPQLTSPPEPSAAVAPSAPTNFSQSAIATIPPTPVSAATSRQHGSSPDQPLSNQPLVDSVAGSESLTRRRERSATLAPPPLILDATDHEDWLDIDTRATSVGYVKHPLTQLLEWVDQILVWLEARLIALWHGLGRLLR